ncbi:MAG: hypothetical protein RR630_10805, partial [Coprobacillus sp.]
NLGSLPTGITELRCEYNELTGTLDVSRLSHLTMLLCSVNKLTSLGSLPTGITELRCEYNELTGTLDVSRLSRLTMLLCNVNKLTSLGTLPSNLNFLDCSDNQISRFDNLPRSMTRLFFGRNKISGVFDLSLLPALIDMGCDNNRITKFSGSLPNSLIALQCSENLLTSLPEIPNAMISLDCTGNKLTKLPKLPSGLEGLFCANNKITSLNLKGLTGLEILLFANNPLKTFISPDGFTCTLTSGRGGQIMSGIAMNKSGEINQYGDSYNLLTKEFTIRAQANSSYRRGMWRTGRSRIAYIGGTSASSESITFKLDRNVTISMNFNRKSPQTDDNNDMALYIGLLMTGLVGMISIAYIQKCKKRSKRNGK